MKTPKRFNYTLCLRKGEKGWHIALVSYGNRETVMHGEDKDSKRDCVELIQRILDGKMTVSMGTAALLARAKLVVVPVPVRGRKG